MSRKTPQAPTTRHAPSHRGSPPCRRRLAERHGLWRRRVVPASHRRWVPRSRQPPAPSRRIGSDVVYNGGLGIRRGHGFSVADGRALVVGAHRRGSYSPISSVGPAWSRSPHRDQSTVPAARTPRDPKPSPATRSRSSWLLARGRAPWCRLGGCCGHCAHHAFAETSRADAERQVEATAHVLQRDYARERYELGLVEVLPQLSE
jgi:hypothetical protein